MTSSRQRFMGLFTVAGLSLLASPAVADDALDPSQFSNKEYGAYVQHCYAAIKEGIPNCGQGVVVNMHEGKPAGAPSTPHQSERQQESEFSLLSNPPPSGRLTPLAVAGAACSTEGYLIASDTQSRPFSRFGYRDDEEQFEKCFPMMQKAFAQSGVTTIEAFVQFANEAGYAVLGAGPGDKPTALKIEGIRGDIDANARWFRYLEVFAKKMQP